MSQMTDYKIDIMSLGMFGEYMKVRVTHKPTGITYEEECNYRYHTELTKEIVKRIKNDLRNRVVTVRERGSKLLVDGA